MSDLYIFLNCEIMLVSKCLRIQLGDLDSFAVTMCFEILELRDLTCDLFQAFFSKTQLRKRFYEKSGAKSNKPEQQLLKTSDINRKFQIFLYRFLGSILHYTFVHYYDVYDIISTYVYRISYSHIYTGANYHIH